MGEKAAGALETTDKRPRNAAGAMPPARRPQPERQAEPQPQDWRSSLQRPLGSENSGQCSQAQ